MEVQQSSRVACRRSSVKETVREPAAGWRETAAFDEAAPARVAACLLSMVPSMLTEVTSGARNGFSGVDDHNLQICDHSSSFSTP
eukprot:m.460583 g.460583  ORF g.460583 m.460583 type:complete len:85 (+) comp22071_c0_seq1:1480-1734(+)